MRGEEDKAAMKYIRIQEQNLVKSWILGMPTKKSIKEVVIEKLYKCVLITKKPQLLQVLA